MKPRSAPELNHRASSAMPDQFWDCSHCGQRNPPYTEVCRECERQFSVPVPQRQSLIVRRRPSHLVGLVIGVVAASIFLGAVPFDMASSRQMLALPLVVLAWFLVLYAEFVRDSRLVEFDLANNRLVVRKRSWRWQLLTSDYTLSQFRSVVSYTVPGRPQRNLVELVTQSGGESFHVSSFDPETEGKSFFSLPHATESPEAKKLRESIAALCSLEDRGYFGSRWTGAYVAPNTPDTAIHRSAAR